MSKILQKSIQRIAGCGLLCLALSEAGATVAITPATGGGAISADTAANAATPAWTTLGPIVIAEGANADFGAGTNITLVLKTPAGFAFNTVVTPSITFTNGRNITSAAVAVTDSSTLTVTLTVSNTTFLDTLVIGQTTGLQLRPVVGTPLATGNHIYRPTTGGGNASAAGLTTSADGSSGSNFGALTEVVGNAAQLALTTQPAGATAGAVFTTQPVVRTQDQFGNNSTNGLAATVNVTMTLTGGTGTLQGTAVTNIGTAGGKGIVTYTNLRIDTTGNKQLTASDGALASVASSAFTVSPAAASKLVIATQPSATANAGTPFAQQPVIFIEDQFNNVRSNDTLTVTAVRNAGSGTLMGTTAMNAVAGVATYTNLAHPTVTNITISFSSGALTAVTSSPISVVIGPLAQLQVLLPGEAASPGTSTGKTGTPTAQTAGTAFNVTVQAVDAGFNLLSNINHTVSLSSSDTTATLPGPTALVNGSVTLSVTMKDAGTQTVTANDTTDNVTSGTSAAVTVNAAAFTKIQLLVPGETAAPGTASGKTGTPLPQTAGTAFTVIVNGVDANWNLVTSATGSGFTMQIASSDPNATLPGNNNLSSGTTTFNVTLKTVGTATLTATDADNTALTNVSPAITVNVGALNKLQVLMPGETAAPGTSFGKTGTPTARTAGTAFNVIVNAVDANWNLVTTNDTIHLTSSDSNATLPADTALTAGTLTLSVTLNAAGNRTVTASDTTHAAVTANTSAAATVNAGAFSKLQLLVPGETAAPGSVSGKTGTPAAQTAGTAFNATVNAVDDEWNLVNTVTHTVGITSSDANATMPANAALVAGTRAFSVTLRTSGTATVTGSDITDGTKTASTGSLTAVNAGAFAKLQLLIPGELAAPGSTLGKTGTPNTQTSSTPFSVTVNAVDANWNLINTNDTVRIASSDAGATLPANTALVAGTRNLSVTLKTGPTATVTASNVTHTAIAGNTSPAISIVGAVAAAVRVETAANGSGIAVPAQSLGTGSAITVYAIARDTNGNFVSNIAADTWSLPVKTGGVLDGDLAATGDRKSATFTVNGTGTATIRASVSGLTSTDSGTITAGAGAFAKLQVLMPGETAAPGTATGKTGAPAAQTAGNAFNVTVNAVDVNWNPISTNDTVAITSTDANTTLPANAALVNGTQVFSVTFKTAGSNSVTASDFTHPGITSNIGTLASVTAGAFLKLQVLMPGETASPGSASGKTGTPSAQTAGTAFNVTVNAVDANWNVVSTVADTVHITSSDANATLPANAALAGGTRSFSVTLNTMGSRTVTATDATDGSKAANTSPATTVNAGAFVKLQLLMPGESAAAGTASGKSGSPTVLTAGSSFTVTVNAVDNNWNVVSSTHTVGITSSDANATLPANAALVAGSRAFSVTFKTAGNQTLTATDITDGTRTPNTGSTTVVNPGAYVKMQLLAPGEIYAPGSASGKTGAPATQFSGTAFSVTVHAVDANWNIISTNDTVQTTSSDVLAVLPANAALSAGTTSFNVTLKTAGTATVTASNVTHAAIAGSTSPAITVSAPLLRGGPVVAIHDSELTRALETMTASNPGTPTGSGTTGFEWWPTNWHYFVMPESLKEALTSDGTAYEVVTDADIAAGKLMTNGQPKYPILISLACEAVRDDEISQLTNYVAAGGTLFVGSSSFTRQTNGAGRGDFAIASQLGLHCTTTNVQNWTGNTTFQKTVDHPLISHFPAGTLTWRLPSGGDEIPWGVSAAHTLTITNRAWQIQAGDATVIAQGSGTPYMAVKNYGKGSFIYHAGMQPLIAHGGYGPGMYAYRIFRNAIEGAFASARVATPRVSPWPYPYDSALNVRHDFEDFQAMISAIESSAQFEATNGARGDYYFCTGTLRVEMSNSPTVIASLRRAVTNYGATIQPHNGGLKNVNNTNLVVSDYDYWHWGLDEALDTTPAGFPNGKAYASASLSNAFNDVEGWLTGITNGIRSWVAPYFNATRENSFDIEQQLGVKITGEQKLTPFPHWTLSTATSGKRYPFLTLPVSDWYVPSEIGQSIEAGHTSLSVHALVDAYHSLGALVNLYSHSSSDGSGAAGGLVQDYIRYAVAKPRIWSTNAVGIYNWWLRRAGVQIVPTFTTLSNQSTLTLAISGAVDPQTAIEAVLPVQNYSSLAVFTNGVAAGTNIYRTNGQTVKVAAGTTVTNAVIQYLLNPTSVGESYSAIAAVTRSVAAPGVLANDSTGAGTNLTAVLVSSVSHGVLNLASNGSFDYTPATNFSGVDSFTYKANDGVSDGNVATVTLSVTPTPSVLFADDFTRGTDPGPLSPWSVQSGTWTITGGEMQGSPASLNSYGFAYVSNAWTDYAVQARIRFPAGAFGGGLGGRLNPVTGAHYSAWIYPENSPGGSRVLKLIKFQDWANFSYLLNIGTPIQQVPLPSVGTNWHTVKVQYEGTQISVFYDDVQMIRTNDVEAVPYLSGGITLDMWNDSSGYVMHADDVMVTAPLTDQTITFNTPSNRTFGDVFAPDVSASSGLPITLSILSGPATVTGTNILVTGVGTVSVRASQSGDASFKAAAAVDRTFTVTPATLTVVPNNVSVAYGSTIPALSASYSGLVNGDTVAVVSGAPVLSTTATATNPVGAYPITATLGTLSATNYTFAFATGQVSITKAPLTVTANNAVRGYGQADPAFTASYSGFVNGDTAAVLSGAPSFTTTAISTSPPGSYSIIPATGTLAAANYTFNFVNGALTVVWSSSLFSDNFTRGSDPGPLSPWVVQSGNWSVTGGQLQGGLSPTFGYGFAYLTNTWTDYAVEARFQFPAGAFGGGLGGRLNSANGAHYAAWIYPEGSPGGSSVLKLIKFQSWGIFGYNGNGFVPIQQVSLPGVGTNWHTLRLTFQTNLITVLYDNVQLISTNDIEAQPYLTGGICVDMWTDSTPYILGVDDVAVLGPPIDQTITFAALTDKVYGDAPFALSASASSGLPVSFSVVSGPGSLSGNILSVTNVGTVTIAASQAGNTNYAPAPSVQRSFSVTPAALTVTADSKSRGYGASNPAFTGSVIGLQNGDDITASYSTVADTDSPVGTYIIAATLNDPANRLPNYSVVTNNGVLTVTPATLTITVDNQTRVYGLPNPPLTGSLTGVQNGDNLPASFITSATSSSNAGNYVIVPVLSDPDNKLGNYNAVTNGAMLTIQKAVLGVRADDKIRVYGVTNPVFTASYSGFVNGDTAAVLAGSPDLTNGAVAGTAIGNYAIVAAQGSLSAGNYSFSFTNGVLTISPASLIGTADNKSRLYGQTNPGFTVTYSGFVNGENSGIVTGTLTGTTTASTNSSVGTYPITVSGQNAPNYAINYVAGTLNVTPAQLLINAQNATRGYGQTNPSFGATITGFVNGEDDGALAGTLSLTSPADTNSPIGTYPIVASGLTSTNYSITYSNGTLTVTPYALSVVADNQTRTYGAANPTFTGTLTGVQNGDNITATYSTTATTNSPVGTYSIVPALSDPSNALTNYSLTISNGTLTVTPAALLVSAQNASRAYGQSNPTFTAAISGFVNGEDTNVLGGALTLSTAADTNSPVGTYPIVASGYTSTNYSISYSNGTLTVLAAPLMVTADNKSRTYGAANPTLTGNILGIQNGDNITATYSTTATTASPVGNYDIVPALADPDGKLSNYSVATNSGTLAVNPAALTGTADNKSRLYGQTNPALTVTYSGFVNGENSGIVAGTLIGTTTADTNSPVGDYPISVSGQSAPNYSITYVDGVLTINPAALLVQADDKSRAYGQTNPILTATISGFVNGENTNVLGGALVLSTTAETNSPIGSYPIVASGLTSTNYSIIYSNGTLTVTPYSLSVVADNQTRAYGAANPTFTGTLTGVQNGDNITATYSTTATTNSPVGTYSIVPTLSDPSNALTNYSVTISNGTLTVTPAALLVSAQNASRGYGQSNPTFTAAISGFVNGGDTNVLGGALTLSTAANTNSPVGTYPIAASGYTSTNYSISFSNGTLTILAAPLTVTADNKSRTYGATNPTLTGNILGIQNGDNITATYSTTATPASSVGNYDIVPALADPDTKLSNYSVITNNGTLVINPAALTGTADNKSRLYGQSNPVFTVTYSGFVNGENSGIVTGILVGTTTADTNSPVGNYPISVSGQSAPNYSMTYVGGILAVNPAALIVQADDKSRAYGQSSPALTATISGFVNAEGTNALSGALVLSTIAATNSPIGTYPIVASGLTSTNYSITFSNGTLTVTPYALSVVADNQTRTYGAANPAFTGTLTGVQNGDNITASYSTTAVTNSPVGPYSIVPTLSDASNALTNYSVTISNGTLTVTPAGLLVSAQNASRAYAQSNPGFTANINGFVNGEDTNVLGGALTLSTAAVTNSPVGTYPIVANGYTSTNYSISYSNGSLTITAASLTVSADNKFRTYGTTNPTLTGNILGIQNGDNITATYSTTATTASPVGNHDIVPALADPDSKLSNYNVTTTNGTLAINPAALTGIADNKSRLYGQTNPGFTVTYSGFVDGENGGIVTGTLIGTTSANTNSPVGSYPISLSGQSAPNYAITYVDGVLTVNPAALLVQANDKSRAYGQANPALTAAISGFVNVEDTNILTGALILSTTADTNSPIGSYPIVASGLTSTNYSITYSNGTLTITPYGLSVVADNQTRTYGAANPTFTGTLTGVQNGDNITASYSTAAVTNSPVGTYSIVPTLNDPSNALTNYSLTIGNGTLTVTPAGLLVSAQNASRGYGQNNPSFTAAISGFVNGEDTNVLGGALTLSTAADTNSPVGTYPIVTSGYTSTNYSISFSNGTLTVLAAPLTVTADNKSRTYGAANPTLTGNILGIQNGDNITATYSTTATPANPVGNYDIVPALADPGSKLSNYNVTINNGTLVVNLAPLTGTADNKSRLYGQTNPVFTVTYSGFVNDENSGIVTGTLIGTTTADTNSPVGNYPISVSGQSAPNYSITYVDGALTINPAGSSLALSSSSNPAPQGSNITFTASVTAVLPTAGAPTGNVQFFANGVASGSPVALVGGTAAISIATLPVGTNMVAAVYAGDANFLSSSNAIAQAITATVPDEPSTLALTNNGDGTVTVILHGTPGVQYEVQAKDDLISGSWQTVSTDTAPAKGNWTYTESTTGHNQRFYRLAKVTGNASVSSAPTRPQTLSLTSNPGGTVTVRFRGTSGTQYVVQAADNVVTGPWINVSTNTAGTDGSWTYTESTAGHVSRCYRSALITLITSPFVPLAIPPISPTLVGMTNNLNGTITMTYRGTAGAHYLVKGTGDILFGAWETVSKNTAGPDGLWSVTEPTNSGWLYFCAIIDLD